MGVAATFLICNRVCVTTGESALRKEPPTTVVGRSGSDLPEICRLALQKHSESILVLMERMRAYLKDGDYEKALPFALCLYSVESDLGWGLFARCLYETGNYEELLKAGLSIIDTMARIDLYSALLEVFRALEAREMLNKGWDILRQRAESLPPDVYSYFSAGLLSLEGKREKARGILQPLRENDFWAPYLARHPLNTGTFLVRSQE